LLLQKFTFDMLPINIIKLYFLIQVTNGDLNINLPQSSHGAILNGVYTKAFLQNTGSFVYSHHIVLECDQEELQGKKNRTMLLYRSFRNSRWIIADDEYLEDPLVRSLDCTEISPLYCNSSTWQILCDRNETWYPVTVEVENMDIDDSLETTNVTNKEASVLPLPEMRIQRNQDLNEYSSKEEDIGVISRTQESIKNDNMLSSFNMLLYVLVHYIYQ